MADYKYEIHLLAENFAQDQYEKDFYSLTPEQQNEVWNIAEDAYSDKMASIADYLVDERKEGL